MDFLAFVLDQLPAPPARVLEVGCGKRGGVTEALAERGYDAVGVDPRAPEGPSFRRERIEEHELGAHDAVVAGRVLHHIGDLAGVLERLAASAPLLLVDEFAWERIDEPTQEWYEGQHRMLEVAGNEPGGPASLDEWRSRHADLHPFSVVRAALDERYEERAFAWRPYLYRWLGGPVTEPLEEMLIGAGAIVAVGCHYAGVRR